MASKLLLKYQSMFAAAEYRYTVRVWEKSRRIGATWGEAMNSVMRAAKRNGTDTWYVGYNKEMSYEFIREVGVMARAMSRVIGSGVSEVEELEVSPDEGVVSSPRDQILSYRVHFDSGYRVTALSSKPTNFRGKKGRVIIDECAFMPSGLQEFLKAALALTMWGGTIALISTHNGEESEFNQICRDIRAGKLPYYLQRTTFDDAIGDGLYERVALMTGETPSDAGRIAWRDKILSIYGEAADEELFCIPSRSGTAYFSPTLIAARSHGGEVLTLTLDDEFLLLDEETRMERVRDWVAQKLMPMLVGLASREGRGRFFYGMDFGRHRDMGAIAILEELPDESRFIRAIVELYNCPYESQREILFAIAEALRVDGGCHDAIGNGDYMYEEASKNFGGILPIKATAAWYGVAFSKFRAEMQSGRLTLADDPNLADDLKKVKLIGGIPRIPEARSKASDPSAKAGKNMMRHCEGAVSSLLAFWASFDRVAIGYGVLSNTPRAPREKQVLRAEAQRKIFW